MLLLYVYDIKCKINNEIKKSEWEVRKDLFQDIFQQRSNTINIFWAVLWP